MPGQTGRVASLRVSNVKSLPNQACRSSRMRCSECRELVENGLKRWSMFCREEERMSAETKTGGCVTEG